VTALLPEPGGSDPAPAGASGAAGGSGAAAGVTEGFGERLRALMEARGPLCVGIDPHPGLLERWGLPDDPSGLARFAETVVAALGDRVAVLKPQAAFFERHGSRGVAALERTVAAIREAGALSIVDAKRGDIGSTMSAYADAYAGEGSPLAGDAVTASPYLGFGSLRPLLDVAARSGRGVFVLALTSNPEGASVQHATGPDGRTVAQTVLDAVAAENAGAQPLGSVGVVVGATITGRGREHALTRLNGPILAPGLGAQGGSADDLRAIFGPALGDVLPTTSRDVLNAGPERTGLRDAAARALDLITG
jgi:orotidine-5'-phosphate decarboxylase